MRPPELGAYCPENDKILSIWENTQYPGLNDQFPIEKSTDNECRKSPSYKHLKLGN
jgi:hypothetical protein